MAKKEFEEQFEAQIYQAVKEGLLPRTLTRELKFHPERRWRFDFADELYRVAVEVQGGIWTNGRHGRGAGIENDYTKWNEAAAMGWTVLPVSTSQVRRGEALNWLVRTINAKRGAAEPPSSPPSHLELAKAATAAAHLA